MRQASRRIDSSRTGRVVATLGRRVMVRDADGDRACFLSGHRAVIGDHVRWEEARGEGGKICDVLPRERTLTRQEMDGREHVLASNLGGLLIVAATMQPPYRPGLIDRYWVAGSSSGLEVGLVITKGDLGVTDEIEADLAWRAEHGLTVIRCTPTDGDGVDDVREFLREHGSLGPWALVGHSGVGKTRLMQTLLPEIDVGPIGEISEFWEQGKHTTTGSRIFEVEPGVELADSPGIRTFLPGGLDPKLARDHFPGMGPLPCKYRDCLHRPGESGCVAEAQIAPDVLTRYRRLLDEVVGLTERMRP